MFRKLNLFFRSPIATLAKAEILAKKIEDDLFDSDDYILHSPHKLQHSIGNEDWLVDIPKERDFNFQKTLVCFDSTKDSALAVSKKLI